MSDIIKITKINSTFPEKIFFKETEITVCIRFSLLIAGRDYFFHVIHRKIIDMLFNALYERVTKIF